MARYSMRSEPDKFVVIIPAFRWSVLALTSSLAIFFAYLRRDGSSAPDRWGDAIFAIRIICIVYVWLWNLGGKEEAVFTPTKLTIRNTLFGLARSKDFNMADVEAPSFGPSYRSGIGRRPSGIEFTYKDRKVRFCNEITQAEAKAIVSAVLNSLPELRPVWGTYVDGVSKSKGSLSLNLK